MIRRGSSELLFKTKSVFSDGSIMEIVLWKVPAPIAGSRHTYKYRLYWGRDGMWIVGFDNERGKGDHCHLDGKEHAYAFTSPEALIEDFYAEIRRRMSK
jgi:hypothetical protein